jgi:HEPN domain-containing protein
VKSKIIEKRFVELIEETTEVDATVRLPKGQYSISDEVDRQAFMKWGMSAMTLLFQVFGDNSLQFKEFKKHYDDFNGWLAEYYFNCKSIFLAAYEDYTNGYIFKLRGLVAADIIEDGLEQAESLLSAGYKDPSCVIAGVCLETSIKELCDREEIEHSKLDKMNADLRKAEVYNLSMQKQITAWADLRNNAAHGNWNEYSNEDVEYMIEGIRRFIANYI